MSSRCDINSKEKVAVDRQSDWVGIGIKAWPKYVFAAV